jgi:GNAT superfamily N-acetyltransferase
MGRGVQRRIEQEVNVSEIAIRAFAPVADSAILPVLADLLVEAVDGGASIGFMAGLTSASALAFWQTRATDVARGDCRLLLAFAGRRLAGTVSLMLATPPNQPHRADVSKMIVGRDVRRRGVGAALLAAVEAEARALGRTTLVLDTISESAAARLYERGGWQRIGEIDAYALMPDGEMAPTTVYARHLDG